MTEECPICKGEMEITIQIEIKEGYPDLPFKYKRENCLSCGWESRGLLNWEEVLLNLEEWFMNEQIA